MTKKQSPAPSGKGNGAVVENSNRVDSALENGNNKAESLAEHAAAIRAHGKLVVDAIIDIGRRLTECKRLVIDHGDWLPFLEREFGWSDQTARNMMQAYEFSETPEAKKFLDLTVSVSAFYLLAAPSTPPEAVAEVAAQAANGKAVSHKQVKAAVQKAKGKSATLPEPGPVIDVPPAHDAVCQRLDAIAEAPEPEPVKPTPRPPAQRAPSTQPKKATKHDLMAAWLAAPFEERQAWIDDISLQAVVDTASSGQQESVRNKWMQ